MLSKADIKYINSLQNKKYRKIEHAFLVEGIKNVEELLHSDYEVMRLWAVQAYSEKLNEEAKPKGISLEIVTEAELQSVGSLENNHSALAIAKIKENNAVPHTGWIIALDGVNDPGNLGTIVRIADWYGIKHLVCSRDTVDFYNPKVINATKGSFTRVEVSYLDLDTYLKGAGLPVLAACMEGDTIYQVSAKAPAILLMGNEANGIREELMGSITQKVHIPRIGQAESLNVGVATGILIDRLLGGK